MGVGHQHHINAAGVKGQRGVVDLVPALLQAAVHQDMLAVDLQTMAAAGNAPVSAVNAASWRKLLLFDSTVSIPHFSALHNRKAARLTDNCSQKIFCIRQKSVVYSTGIIMYDYLFT